MDDSSPDDTPLDNISADQKDPSDTSVYPAERKFLGVPVQVHMLSNGVPVVAASSFAAVIMRLGDESTDSEVIEFGRWLQSLPATPTTGD